MREDRRSIIMLKTPSISAVGVALQTIAEEIFAVSIPVPKERFETTRGALIRSLSEFYERSISSSLHFVDGSKVVRK